ncbi:MULTISPECIES: isopentenyl-diphosphate delta-isomerase [Stappiaceae]|uniref:isopentenyl-diphosphate delta-isomerase n=1 Tax=Stappiaceae TaxID=2821832 RepID=UPI001ADC567E|nr:isopentenyl-diphosphate delta-isomerase [Labrenzia sp. R4_1]MBO9424011.1 isopentenyl-diphosphate delta-isomerase [Labrenzia sp. R4_1]
MNKPLIIPAVAPDGSFYPVEKLQAHIDGVLHLAVSVFVFDGDHLLIQKRAAGKYHCGGQWANTCCSHPHWDESVETCAERRLMDELGFTLPLTRHQTVEYEASVGEGLKEHERVTLFSAQVDRNKLIVAPNPDEVEDVRWVTAADLHREVLENPNTFTPWFRIYLGRFPGLKFQAAA